MANAAWIFALLLHYLATWTEAGPKCFECSRIPFPRDCNHVTECGTHEVCHTAQFVTDSGHVFYDTGCLDSLRCNGKRAIADVISLRSDDETGDLVTCIECCNGDYCNTQGCGSQPLQSFPVARGPLCFNCPHGTVAPEDCDLVTVCSRDEHCSIEPMFGIAGDRLYKTGCKKCQDTGSILVGKRATSVCSGCCKTDFCNRDCPSVSASSTTTLVTSSLTPMRLELSSSTSKVAPTSPFSAMSTPAMSSASQPSTEGKTASARFLKSSTTAMPTTPLDHTMGLYPKYCRNDGYTYDPQHGICYKVYDKEMKTMAEARASCQHEHADLLQLRDNHTETYFLHEGYDSKNVSDRRYWLGATRHSDNQFYWFNGKVVSAKDYVWGAGEPNNAHTNHEDCLEFMYNSAHRPYAALNDDNCERKGYYICEERCPDKSYTYVPAQDLCFKIHASKLTWDQARAKCISENADLAQPNTPEKIDFFHKYLTTLGTMIYWIGGKQSAHNPHKFFWLNSGQTITGDLWHQFEPNNPSEQCASLYWYNRQPLDMLFRINDLRCDTPESFICEYLW